MSGFCKQVCQFNNDRDCKYDTDECLILAHKPEPNESPSSPRTRGSLAASPGQNEVEGTVLNSPPFSGRAESLLSQTGGDHCVAEWGYDGCDHVQNCHYCEYYR